MTGFDRIAEANGDDECRAWLRKVIDAKDEIVAFVDHHLDGGGTGEFDGYLKGSFNLCLHVRFGHGRQSALIRFAKPGHTTWRAEKTANEVRFMEYLSQHTTIPVPRVHHWGLTEDSPQKLGPFIVMDFDDQEDVILDPNIDTTTLDTIYDQLADYLLQLSQIDFPSIGSISKDSASNAWSVTGRPLTYNMNELATATGYPADQFPTGPFDHASDYFGSLANQHIIHLQTQRNIADDAEDARKKFIARHRFRELIPKHCIDDTGPFKVFCDDLQPSNMLVDPHTLRITAVLDFEFTNVMPAQFTYDPPWWLVLLGPDMWLERYSMADFVSLYKPRMEQFLQALERVEAKRTLAHKRLEEPHLSARMRDSWESGRFWFNYAARKSMDIDAVYWNTLHEDGTEEELLDNETRVEMEAFVKTKMEQLETYREECAERFS
ncbi:hypothetical protein QBC33DRAFT_612748 [Phialemonium atrogriseum]|uniref:Aminoglycoside phosphotransferase domain-containing protein n=1 Tax=Phialemonium atrogriseum TaxID=1093897 RepID=A0AAJ0FLF6_9PEZI|nr:uncharacterized protein QBC33DRAFT_612748 [Phialemonium atrogriseum]KAK1765060.1 hypothetical protein QBC33DRAFT_612748 [Phialemonium atrogriseum]